MYIKKESINAMLTRRFNEEFDLLNSRIDDTISAYDYMRRNPDENNLFNHQQIVFEEIVKIINFVKDDEKNHTIIIDSTVGSGKSFLAYYLLVCDNYVDAGLVCNNPDMTREIQRYYPIKKKIKSYYLSKDVINPGALYKLETNTYQLLIVDDAHLLKDPLQKSKSQLRKHIRTVFKSSKINVFFLNTLEKINPFDEIVLNEIIEQAKLANNIIHRGERLELNEPCRCNQDQNYVSFIKQFLGFQPFTDQKTKINFDLRIYDNPTKMRQDIMAFERKGYSSELVTCYPYHYKSHPDFLKDPEVLTLKNNFKVHVYQSSRISRYYNHNKHRDEVKLHTGVRDYELHYVGVIIGKEISYRNNKIETDLVIPFIFSNWHRELIKQNDLATAQQLVRSIYYELLTKGHKGCFIYCEDKKLREYLHNLVKNMIIKRPSIDEIITNVIPVRYSFK